MMPENPTYDQLFCEVDTNPTGDKQNEIDTYKMSETLLKGIT